LDQEVDLKAQITDGLRTKEKKKIRRKESEQTMSINFSTFLNNPKNICFSTKTTS
jgi:hypothetical protein